MSPLVLAAALVAVAGLGGGLFTPREFAAAPDRAQIRLGAAGWGPARGAPISLVPTPAPSVSDKATPVEAGYPGSWSTPAEFAPPD